jgi:hypothetical protein
MLNCDIYMMSRIWLNVVTCRGDLQDGVWIGWLDLLSLIHSHSSGLQAIRRYHYSTHFQFRDVHALAFSLFTSGILATDLSQSHCNFKSPVKFSLHGLIPFLSFLLSYLWLPFPELDPILILSRLLHFTTTVLYSYGRTIIFRRAFYVPL